MRAWEDAALAPPGLAGGDPGLRSCIRARNSLARPAPPGADAALHVDCAKRGVTCA